MELQILNWIQNLRTPAGDVFWPFITKFGNAGIIWILLTVALLLVSVSSRYARYRKSGVVLAAALCADLILCNGILKHLFSRVRPCDVNTSIQLLIARPEDFSFPSGHTAASFAAVTALYLSGNKKLGTGALVLAVLIAFSRLYLYVHYPTDVLGGMAAGIAAGYIGYFIVKRFLSYQHEKHSRKGL